MKNFIKGFGRIQRGAKIFHDLGSCVWPQCKPPKSEYDGKPYKGVTTDPDKEFEVEWDGSRWKCRADGYGLFAGEGEYGNGAILIRDYDSVEIIL
jgi:hypothetical protein